MIEKLETKNASSEQPKITNLAELKILFDKEFGIYSAFFKASLIKLSGYEAPKSMFIDTDKEKEREKIMLSNTKITPEIIENLNKVIAYRAKIMEEEVKWAKQRNNEKHQKECQEILDLLQNKRLILTEAGTTEIQEQKI